VSFAGSGSLQLLQKPAVMESPRNSILREGRAGGGTARARATAGAAATWKPLNVM
jgi:hypothetical protein